MPLLLYIPLSNQGPFPPRQLPRFLSTTGLSATLTTQSSPHGFPVGTCHAIVRVPVLSLLSSCLRASANTPAETDRCSCRTLPDLSSAFPIMSNGSASALPVSRLAQHSLKFRPAGSPSRPRRPFYPECFKPCRYLHDPPWLLPTGATVVGQVLHLSEKSTFPRRTIKMGQKISCRPKQSDAVGGRCLV